MFYVVTKGSYSCYHIVAVTADRSVAERIATKFSSGWEDCEIEAYEDGEVMLKPVWTMAMSVGPAISSIKAQGWIKWIV